MAIRFDAGYFTKDPYLTHDGVLLCEAAFARDGVLEYRDSETGQVRRELRLPEENQRAIAGFGIAPLTDEHPSELVNQDNAARLRKGISLSEPKYVVVPGKGGYVTGQVAVFDSTLVQEIVRGDRRELSAGYKCRIDETPGIWQAPDGKKIKYDAIQRDLEINHIALTQWGRAGPECGLHLRRDHAEDVAYQIAQRLDDHSGAIASKPAQPTPSIPMTETAQLNVPGGAIHVPRELFSQLAPHVAKLDSLTNENEKLTTRIDALTSDLEKCRGALGTCETKNQYQVGRSDGLAERLEVAEALLAELGFVRQGDDFVRAETDSDDEEYMDEEDEEYMEDGDDEEYMDEEDEEYIKDSLVNIAKTMALELVRIDGLLPGFSETHGESIRSLSSLKRLAVAELRPDLADRLDEKSDDYVWAMYDMMVCDRDGCEFMAKDEGGKDKDRGDSQPDYSTALSQASRRAGRMGSGAAASAERRMNRYKEPLTATRKELR